MAGATGLTPFPHAGAVGRKGVRIFSHRVAIGASGAISAQDADSGIVATKNGTAGNYTLQFPRSFKRIVSIGATFIGPVGVNTTGSWYTFLTNQLEVNPVTGSGSSAGNIILQWLNLSASSAADVPSGTVFIVTAEVEFGV